MTDAEHLQDGARLLCRRKKNVDVFILPGGKKFRVVAEMKDEVHHMRINMIVNQPSLRIKAIDCEMPGVPDDICLETRSFFQPLIGKRIIGGLMQDMKSLTHKACTHLVNLFHEACYNITLAQSVLGEEQLTELFPGLTQEQLFTFYLWFTYCLLS